MPTVVGRTFRSNPYRDAAQTWTAIVELLRATGEAKSELNAVAGIGASIIADQAPQSSPIIITCNGPRARIYCVYDEDAIDGSGENENPLGFDPLQGDWRVSLPCLSDDLTWVQAALKKYSSRITARVLSANVSEGEVKAKEVHAFEIDLGRFLNP